MIVLTNSASQVINAGDSLTFDTVITHTGCAECFRKGTGSVKMRANNGGYEVHFNGNVTSTATGAAQLSLALSGDTLPETAMTTTIATIGDISNLSATTLVKNCCVDYDRITVTNTGTIPVTVSAYPTLFVKRISWEVHHE